ncbi:hypothetical protein ABK040_006581 [Willaertia magna]
MNKLPEELLITHIFSFSSLFDLFINFKLVCKQWDKLIDDNCLNYLKNEIGFLDCNVTTNNKLQTLKYINNLLQKKYKDYFEIQRKIKELNFSDIFIKHFNQHLDFKLFLEISPNPFSSSSIEQEDFEEVEQKEEEEEESVEEERKKRKLDLTEKLMANTKEDNCDIGQSKFGGFPDLPKQYLWPKDQFNNDLLFVCQLNIKHLTFFLNNNFLKNSLKNFPKRDGMLYFWISKNTQDVEETDPNTLTCVTYLSEKEIKEMGNLERRINPIVSDNDDGINRSEFCRENSTGKQLPYFCHSFKIQFFTMVSIPDENLLFESMLKQLNNNNNDKKEEEMNQLIEEKEKYKNRMVQQYSLISRAFERNDDNNYGNDSNSKEEEEEEEESCMIREEIIYGEAYENEDGQLLLSFEGGYVGLYESQSFGYCIKKEDFKNGNFSRAFYMYGRD